MKANLSDKINIAVTTAAVSGVIWITTNFVNAEEFRDKITEITLQVAYGQFYDRLDDYEEALAEDRQELASEYLRQMERIKAEICEHDPQWERC